MSLEARWRARRRLRFTREGKIFTLFVLAIGFAAINTGNNLLYLVLGMMLMLIIVSGVLSEMTLSRLRARRELPRRIFARQPALIGVTLNNGKSRFSSFSIEAEDLLAGRTVDKRCYFLKVLPGRTQTTSYRHTFERRGLYQLDAMELSTRFPFSLFRKRRQLSLQQEIVVYPELHVVSCAELGTPDEQQQHAVQLGRRGEFHALRDFRQGDDPRDIHWRKSARVGRLLARQSELPSGQRLVICFDNGQDSELLSPADLDRREAAVGQAASLALHLLGRGFAVGLITRTATVTAGSGEAQADHILRALALLQFVSRDRPFAAALAPAERQILVTVSGISASPARQSAA
jgi:uncharacterized protein (DUF58 family)